MKAWILSLAIDVGSKLTPLHGIGSCKPLSHSKEQENQEYAHSFSRNRGILKLSFYGYVKLCTRSLGSFHMEKAMRIYHWELMAESDCL